MQFLIIMLMFFLSLNSFASTDIGQIHAIDYPANPSQDILVFLSSGKVAKIRQAEIKTHNFLNDSMVSKDWLKFTLNSQMYVQKVEFYQGPKSSTNKNLLETEPDEYIPSVLKNEDWAKKYFAEAKRKDKESQCFNRAHVWSYEWSKKHKFNSSKIFLFFTRKFIRENNFTWWFHVAPYLHVNVQGRVRERVMDMKYTTGPTQINSWIKRFIKLDKPGCLKVNTFSDYANFPENGNCYIMKANMYYYWPLDLENEELHGVSKTSWLDDEIKTAYLEAFDITK